MSDDWIRVAPTNPSYVPSEADAEAALAVIADLMPRSQEIVVESSPEVAFIDAGVNVDSMRCPSCRGELSHEWWSNAVAESHDRSGFRERTASMPCCGAVVDLNDIDYGEWPVAFARWWVDCMNPDVGRLTDVQVARLAAALRHEVTIVYQHL